MNIYTNTVSTVVITFLVTFLLNTIANYYTSDKGTIEIGRPVQINGKLVSIITIENFTSEYIDGIAIEIPSTLTLPSITSDSPIVLVENGMHASSQKKLIKISQIAPKLITHVFLPLDVTSDSNFIRVANIDQVSISLRNENTLESPIKKAINTAFFAAIIYSLFTYLGLFEARKEIKRAEENAEKIRQELNERMNKAKEASDCLHDELEKQKKFIAEIESNAKSFLKKQRMLLQSRIFDYSKELNFWRDTIKQLLIRNGHQPLQNDEILKTVTEKLGTYGTYQKSESFENTRVAVAWLIEAEQKDPFKAGNSN